MRNIRGGRSGSDLDSAWSSHMAPRAVAGWLEVGSANGACQDREVGTMWGFLLLLLLWLIYPRYDHAGAQGKMGSRAAQLELVQVAAPPVLPLPFWHQSFLQTMRLGLPWGGS